jgi:hypothetical protein
MTDPAAAQIPTVDEMAVRLLHQGRDEPREVVVLTDADLLALDGVDGEHVAPLPWLGRRDRATKELAAELGWRQLAARGLAAAAYEPEIEVHVSLQVQAALHMRRAASAIVLAQQDSALGTNTLVIYGQGALGLLAEAVDSYGLHRFSTMSATRGLDALIDFAVPTGDFAPHDGPQTVYSEQEWTTGADTLGQAASATVLVGISRSSADVVERRLSIYALPGRAVAAAPVEDGLGVRDVTRDTVVDLLRRISGSTA